jgi:hypothetical protein
MNRAMRIRALQQSERSFAQFLRIGLEPVAQTMRRTCDGSHQRSRNHCLASTATALRAQPKETTMFRKLALAFVATASLGAAALAPSTASAHGWGFHGGHHGHHFHGYAPGFQVGFVGVEPGCYVSRRVMTAHGMRWRTVNRCY